jgi:hypothetical protein
VRRPSLVDNLEAVREGAQPSTVSTSAFAAEENVAARAFFSWTSCSGAWARAHYLWHIADLEGTVDQPAEYLKAAVRIRLVCPSSAAINSTGFQKGEVQPAADHHSAPAGAPHKLKLFTIKLASCCGPVTRAAEVVRLAEIAQPYSGPRLSMQRQAAMSCRGNISPSRMLRAHQNA